MFMKRNGVTEDGGEEERRNLVSRRGLKETGDAMIGANSEGSMGVGREVKGGDGGRRIQPAATPSFGHRLSPRPQKIATAQQTPSDRPTLSTGFSPAPAHTPPLRLSAMPSEKMNQMLTSKLANHQSPVTNEPITRSPDQPTSQPSAPAGPHSPASVIGGLR